MSDGDCAICHLKMILPTTVDGCGHQFCFLCIKGVALLPDGLCPMCRGPLNIDQFIRPVAENDVSLDMRDPEDSFTQPQKNADDIKVKQEIEEEPANDSEAGPSNKDKHILVDEARVPVLMRASTSAETVKPKVFWLYKGGNAWWRYDPRTEKDIEIARVLGKATQEVIACGVTYVIDFGQMIQYRRDNMHAKREIQRIEGKDNLIRMNIKGIAGVRLH